MNKKIIIFPLILAGLLFLSGCGKNGNQNGAPKGNSNEESTASEDSSSTQTGNSTGPKVCKEEKVELPNYGDPGKRLKNCFVQFPGEPSRQDKSYYIVEDICGQFTQQFMENMLGIKLAKIEPPKFAGLNNCSYYFDDKEYVLLNLEYLTIENQKKGNEFAGYKTEKSDKIPMDNLIAWQDSDTINTIYLVLNPNKFISLRPISKKTFSSADKFINFAANLAGTIKGYK